ncbi:cation diffusion facilitator family transporter [Vallitalea okinawensis]|uniref:cation diffusion facilitator family transporter n=1 Tax=Vallitalea okinawensis TaxID=2078660 RepID=UPI000CFB26A3|nr:cation diffusion facilitator family transporter [Vallitalea okinawensis]
MDRYESANRVAVAGIIANVFLVLIKLLVGFQSKSQAMIADGLNSAGDVFASLVTWLGNKISSKPGDEDHPYGHGKAEYIFSIIISFSLILVAMGILRSAYESIINQEAVKVSITLIAVALFTIVLKFFLYRYCKNIGLKYDNLLVLANAEDHRNDVFITGSVLLSIIFSQLGIYWLDAVVGIAIGLWIIYTAIKIFLSAYNVLMDRNIDPKIEKDLIEEIENFKGVLHVDSMTAKPIGIYYLLIVKISMDGNMTVFESHDVATEIKYHLKTLTDIEDVVVHINPH